MKRNCFYCVNLKFDSSLPISSVCNGGGINCVNESYINYKRLPFLRALGRFFVLFRCICKF